jgi:hypothetical protein
MNAALLKKLTHTCLCPYVTTPAIVLQTHGHPAVLHSEK